MCHRASPGRFSPSILDGREFPDGLDAARNVASFHPVALPVIMPGPTGRTAGRENISHVVQVVDGDAVDLMEISETRLRDVRHPPRARGVEHKITHAVDQE